MPRPAWSSRPPSPFLHTYHILGLGSKISNGTIIAGMPSLQQKRNLNVFAEFVKSIRKQIEENKEFQKSVKQLSAETSKVSLHTSECEPERSSFHNTDTSV